MKNVTITMEDADAEWIRVAAAKRNTSVSRMLGEQVGEMRRREDAYERALQDWLGKERRWKSDGSPYPSRAETSGRGQ
ncbi:MAG TPA: CopG family transcriptional regulator [Burkholderiaceae bacterium]|nr:CopG family transcriptional regulator [Burkholderiaceae bacterium]